MKKLVVLCGGTGGHFYPGLAVAKKFNQNGGKAYLFIGELKSKKHMKEAEKGNLKVKKIKSSKFSSSPLGFLKFLSAFILGFIQSFFFFLFNRPDAVLGMGSYTSIPSAIAAVCLGIPVFIHEQNSVAGRANLLLSKISNKMFTAFPLVNFQSVKCSIINVGIPVREEIFRKFDKKDAIEKISENYKVNFDLDKKLILIFGGSQGAKTLNTVIPKILVELYKNEIEVIHISGKEERANVFEYYKQNSVKALVLEYCDMMPILYSASDFVVCRSGASTLAELSYYGKPSILIPYPFASDNHQFHNAKFFEKIRLGETVENSDCTNKKIKEAVDAIAKCIKNSGYYKDSALTSPTTSSDILCEIEKIVDYKKNVSLAE